MQRRKKEDSLKSKSGAGTTKDGSKDRDAAEDRGGSEDKDKDSQKGLRHFSLKVCAKLESKRTTTYNEVADELVTELAAEARALEDSAHGVAGAAGGGSTSVKAAKKADKVGFPT